ncbi:MAG: hypothetical protein NXI20_28520 [bacterium]|nr:hypothetical protein [bacterium]
MNQLSLFLLCILFVFSCTKQENNEKADAKTERAQVKKKTTIAPLDKSSVDSIDTVIDSTETEVIQEEEIEPVVINDHAIQIGKTLLIYTQKDTLKFVSEPLLEENKVIYKYKSFNEESQLHVICADYWENYGCFIIDHKNGTSQSIWTDPIFSENDSAFISKSEDYGLEYTPNGFQLWQLNSENNWTKTLEVNQQEWIPVTFQWISNDSFNVQTVTKEHFESSNWDYNNLSDFDTLSFKTK